MKYISLFSGIGGLESPTISPLYFCESDPACNRILSKIYPQTSIYPDVRSLPKKRADVCVAGWPCQDLTMAGRQRGIYGSNSSLFFRMVEVAVRARVHTIIGENVPNIIRLRGGKDFSIVLREFVSKGFPYVAWRFLNAREFGLPQDRERVIFVASKNKKIALALHRPVPDYINRKSKTASLVSGFYWTGGKQSICFSENFIPALKVGASPPKGGTSPVAVFYKGKVRKLSTSECLNLQGFDPKVFEEEIDGVVYRMSGNAVPKPMGAFAVETTVQSEIELPRVTQVQKNMPNGMLIKNEIFSVAHQRKRLADDLHDYIDLDSTDSLSNQAAAGLLVRLIKSDRIISLPLFETLYQLSQTRTPLRGTKVNSFEILHEKLDVKKYRKMISTNHQGSFNFA